MDPLIEPLAEDAWTHLPPAAAALFIVLILILVGGIWLATTYMKTYGARRKTSEECEPEPAKKPPGPLTMYNLTRKQIDDERARSNQNQDKRDESQDSRIARCEERIDRNDQRVDELYKVEGKHHERLLFEIKRLERWIERIQGLD